MKTHQTAVVNQLLDSLISLRSTHADYSAALDDTDPDFSTRSELLSLIEAAPTPEIKYFLFGKLTSRISLAAMNGRRF
jgi:hypothetical protein